MIPYRKHTYVFLTTVYKTQKPLTFRMSITEGWRTHVTEPYSSFATAVDKHITMMGVELCCSYHLCQFLHVSRLNIYNVCNLLVKVSKVWKKYLNITEWESFWNSAKPAITIHQKCHDQYMTCAPFPWNIHHIIVIRYTSINFSNYQIFLCMCRVSPHHCWTSASPCVSVKRWGRAAYLLSHSLFRVREKAPRGDKTGCREKGIKTLLPH